MPHRHLTLERYELSLEEQPAVAVRMRARARDCPRCAAALTQPALAQALSRWPLPEVVVDRPVDWRRALRRAIAPASQRPPERPTRRWRLPAVAVLVAGILLATSLPAAAGAGADSKLFAVRGWEEDARWSVTPEQGRAALDADLAAEYLWLAQSSAARGDRAGYEVSMVRFFMWGRRLKADIRTAPAAERSRARASVQAAMSLVPATTSAGPKAPEAKDARSLLNDVEDGAQQHEGQQGQGGDTQHSEENGPAGPGGGSQDGGQGGGQGGSTSGRSSDTQDGP